MRKIKLLISGENLAFAARGGKKLFYSLKDYLFALLGTALLREMDEQNWPREPNEDEAGGMPVKAEPAELLEFDDLDDRIPL